MASPLAGVLTSKYSLAVLLILLLGSPRCHAGDNITAILAAWPELGQFSSLLTSTGLARDIMERTGQFTILAVGDDDMTLLRAMPPEAIRQHLSLHVLRSYYDSDMLGIIHPGEYEDVSTLYSGMVEISGPNPGNRGRVSFLPLGPAAGRSGVWQQALFVRAMYEDLYRMAVLQVSATMSAPWLPGNSARRDATMSAVDATGGCEKKN